MLVQRRRRGFGAYDAAAYADYMERVRRGMPYEPNANLEDPNGGIIHFDANGINDSYSPPPSYQTSASGAPPMTDNVVNKDPYSTFYGWTAYQLAAFWRAQGTLGQITDMVKLSGKPGPNGVIQYDQAVIDQSDAALLAFSQSDQRVKAALDQMAKYGTYRGEQGQKDFDASNAQAIENNARELLASWLSFRDNMIRQNPANRSMPRMPPESFLGTALLPGVKDAIIRMVNALPPEAPIVPTQTTTVTNPTPTTTTSGPSFDQANPGSSSGPMPVPSGAAGPGFSSDGGGVPSLPSSGQMGGVIALVGVAVLGLMLRRKR